jgi:uncharacterized protein (DUF1330 family)
MEKKSMPAYLVYICQGVSDRKELETYWKDMPPTFMGFDVKLHTVYRPFELLEGEGPVEGVVVAEFPSMEEAKRWYDTQDTSRCATIVCEAQSILACSSMGE